MPIGEKTKEKFKATFVTNAEHFFDPQFKPGHFRIAKRHAHLKRYKENLFERNGHSEVYIPEYFHCTVEDTLFSNLERFIGVKFLSETYDECWANTNERFTIFDRDLFLYKTRRTCLKGFRYLLTEYHQLYICGFSGTIDQFLQTTAALHTYMTCERSSCLGYFIECAKYMIEDGHANLAPAKGQTTETSLHDLKLMESLLKSYNSSKIYAYHSEKAGTSIALPKDAFSFVLTDAIVRKSVGGPDKVRIYLTYNECLTMKMYPKVKSVSYCEVFGDDDATLEANSVPNLSKYKRQRTGVGEDNAETKMLEKMMKFERKCYFTFVPLALYICCTIDSTQGLTINSPVLALLTQTDRAEDIIVALTRTSNPDCLLIANDIFDTNFEPIAHETKELLRLANATQRRTGWL